MAATMTIAAAVLALALVMPAAASDMSIAVQWLGRSDK